MNELQKRKEELEGEKNLLERLIEQTVEDIICEAFKEIEEEWYSPYCHFSSLEERKLKFLGWLSENYYSHKETCLIRFNRVQRELEEINEALEEIQKEKELKVKIEIEITETEEVPEDDDLEFIIMMDIRNKNIDIEKKRGHYPKDLRWVYKEFFNINIENDKELERAEREGIFKEMMSW